jgi:hypothetical protein
MKIITHYWFVSYHFVANSGFGFGNCWVKGTKTLNIPDVEKWAKDRGNFKNVKVLYFTKISKIAYDIEMKAVKGDSQ